MTATELTHASRIPTPATIGQSTAVEQARAEAEVKAAVVVAQQCPRDVAQARTQMIESCEQIELAQRAFFRFPRAGSQITGPSIHLARELARCWGNVQYGIAEMRRDDAAGESEMMAFAWDVQTNTRNSSTFIVPHKRDKTGVPGGVPLTETRDIYENNANQGARRVREAIFAVLPPWFSEQAKAVCNATIERGDGTPLPDRIEAMLAAYERAGITKRQLETKVGIRADNWTARDVAALAVVWQSLVARESTAADEFPSRDAADVPTSSGLGAALAGQTDADEPAPDDSPAPGRGVEATGGEEAASPSESPLLNTSGKLAKHMFAVLGEANITGREERLAKVSEILGRDVGSSSEMTDADAERVIAALDEPDADDDYVAAVEGQQ